MLKTDSTNFVKVEFGARFGAGESTLAVVGRCTNEKPRALTDKQSELELEQDASDLTADISTFGTDRPIDMTVTLTIDSNEPGEGVIFL